MFSLLPAAPENYPTNAQTAVKLSTTPRNVIIIESAHTDMCRKKSDRLTILRGYQDVRPPGTLGVSPPPPSETNTIPCKTSPIPLWTKIPCHISLILLSFFDAYVSLNITQRTSSSFVLPSTLLVTVATCISPNCGFISRIVLSPSSDPFRFIACPHQRPIFHLHPYCEGLASLASPLRKLSRSEDLLAVS